MHDTLIHIYIHTNNNSSTHTSTHTSIYRYLTTTKCAEMKKSASGPVPPFVFSTLVSPPLPRSVSPPIVERVYMCVSVCGCVCVCACVCVCLCVCLRYKLYIYICIYIYMYICVCVCLRYKLYISVCRQRRQRHFGWLIHQNTALPSPPLLQYTLIRTSGESFRVSTYAFNYQRLAGDSTD